MSKEVTRNLVIEHADIGFRNFQGKADKFNAEGNRHFTVFFEHDHGEELEQEGWNIKWLQAREEGDLDKPIMEVTLNYMNIPPKVVLVSGPNKTIMNEDTVGILDWADIENVDLIIRPYNWEVNGRTGVKAYVKTMYVTIQRDEFAHKYDDLQENTGDVIPDITSDEDPF